MFFIYRALNEFDINYNPLFDGLASKKLIYDLTSSYLHTNEKEFLKTLSTEEKEKYIKENMMTYIKTHKHKMKKMIDKKTKIISQNLSKIELLDYESWSYLLYYLSTLNTHLSNGSRTITNWISASKDLNTLKKYYSEQEIHKIAILGTTSNGVVDKNTIVIDLSTKEIIKDILPFISKKPTEKEVKQILTRVKNGEFSNFFNSDILKPTSENFRGFNYATSDKEVCIYRYYPSDNIICVLEALQLDLIGLNLFNFKYISLSKQEQQKQLSIFKQKLKSKLIQLNDPYIIHIFEELYINNKSVRYVRENIFEESRINYNRTKILKLAKTIPNIQIKK